MRDRFNTPIIIFLTICTKNRQRILANAQAHELLKSTWQKQPTWLVGRYIIMPDHIHLFCAPATLPPSPISPWVKFWKSSAARLWPQPKEGSPWQRHFWDTQLRRGENYAEKWRYVMENAVRAGLVKRAEDWPYQGELNVLQW